MWNTSLDLFGIRICECFANYKDCRACAVFMKSLLSLGLFLVMTRKMHVRGDPSRV